jgi:hypothetical protein
MPQVSFNPSFDIGGSSEKGIEVNASDNCALKNTVLRKMNDRECDEYELTFEIEVMREESEVWGAIMVFMENYFSLTTGITDISQLVDQDLLMFLPGVDRFELVREIVLNKFPRQEKLVNVIIFVQTARYRGAFYESLSSNLWLQSETYAISPVLFGYLFGIGRNLFSESEYGSDDSLPRLPLGGFSDRQVCKFILESSIFKDCELNGIYQEGRRLASGEVEPRSDLYKRACKFDRYITAMGPDIFSRVPIRRMDSDDALFESC